MLCAALALLLFWVQDIDSIVLKNSERFSLVSQITDPREAEAFLAIRRATDPAARYHLASEFLKTYPQSWLLSQTYDASARSAIDLNLYDAALADGAASLRLHPENPSLLVLVSNLEALKGLSDQAIRHASDALEYLDQFEKPPDFAELKASAFFARARAESSLNSANALVDLNHAVAWNPEDAEAFYLRAIVEIRTGDKQSAAADLSFVAQHGGDLRDKAAKVLSLLGVKPDGRTPTVDASLRDDELKSKSGTALQYGYAGSEACKSCHRSEYAAWRQTGMARMLRAYKHENVVGDFSGGFGDSVRMGFDKRPYFEFLKDGNWSRYYVDFTIGSKWQQAYATQLSDGRLQVFPIQFNLLQNKWVNYWSILDPAGSPRAVVRDFPKLTTPTNYQQNCAICHTSQLKISENSLEHATYLQPGIDCEMCHGPAAWHVKHLSDTPLKLKVVGNREAVRVCAQCHSQSAVREFGANGEMNYSTKSKFVPSTQLRNSDAFSLRAFYKDGRFRETTFIVEAFTRSACYRRGAAKCNTCHSPHLPNFESNKTALKFKDTPNQMCVSCHSEYSARIEEHTHHSPDSEASQCITCHMPRITNALLFQARSHQIEIPTADLTLRFGQSESPNVCLSCHSEKPVNWAMEQLAVWRGGTRASARNIRVDTRSR
jgi:predicted CXXCH cytochrome family protein